MRMRRKKHREERIERCGAYLAGELEDYKDDLGKIFPGSDNELHIEIGCGKGKFACEFAANNPDINLIALERSANVIVGACEKAKEMGLNNLKFIKSSAEYTEKYIQPECIERLFLNFSCPFPKAAYASHRLTHKNFLEIYKKILKKGAEIHQKTDNMHFFEISIEQFTNSGFALKNVSLDLHNSGFEGNIETEYEHRFASLGQPIYRLEAFLND